MITFAKAFDAKAPSSDWPRPLIPLGRGFRFSLVLMEETGSLDFLIGVQGEIKRCREPADLASDRKLAAELTRIADEMEQRVRELDRL
jgi:hypothetical protein